MGEIEGAGEEVIRRSWWRRSSGGCEEVMGKRGGDERSSERESERERAKERARERASEREREHHRDCILNQGEKEDYRKDKLFVLLVNTRFWLH